MVTAYPLRIEVGGVCVGYTRCVVGEMTCGDNSVRGKERAYDDGVTPNKKKSWWCATSVPRFGRAFA